MFFKFFTVTLFSLLLVTGCASTHTAVSKRNLNVETKMSDAIFVAPVAPQKRKVLVTVTNTSAYSQLNIAKHVKTLLRQRGFKIVEDPDNAQYLLQAKILHVGRINAQENKKLISAGFDGGATGAAAGATLGGIVGNNDKDMLTGGLIGAIVGVVADASVEDVTYSIVTDLQISERAAKGVTVREKLRSILRQGSGAKRRVSSREKHNWKRYQTRIISTANKVNLKLEEALPQLVAGQLSAIAGVI